MFFLWRRRRRVRRTVEVPRHAYKDGELIYVWGEPLQLRLVTFIRDGVYQEGQNLILASTKPLLVREKEALLESWFKEQLAARLPALFARAEQIVGRQASSYYVRTMKTRWGTCNVKTGRVCLNARLAHLQPAYLEYIIIHELTHLWERGHGAPFKEKMDLFCPDWRHLRRQLREDTPKAF
ncbi:MAG: M48 family metallopeptidase [Acidaminococcaceae bacterium]|jgi:predicted metal-dependent hydrolase|nr:M48 family metallopeptidase [Acidaminococcaceae bacterium]